MPSAEKRRSVANRLIQRNIGCRSAYVPAGVEAPRKENAWEGSMNQRCHAGQLSDCWSIRYEAVTCDIYQVCVRIGDFT